MRTFLFHSHQVDLVDKIPSNTLTDNVNNLKGSPMVRMEIALDAMRALAALSRSLGVRMVLYKCGILHVLPTLLLCKEEDLRNNVLLIIMYCASIVGATQFNRNLSSQGLNQLSETSLNRRVRVGSANFDV